MRIPRIDLPNHKSDKLRARQGIIGVLAAYLMASGRGVFFSKQVLQQIQAVAYHTFVFGTFPEMTISRSPLHDVSTSEIESS
jgi:hypothetical protein